MLDKLFSSKTRAKILKLLLLNPDDSYYQRQISALVNHPIRGVQREMEKFYKLGLIEKETRGNRIYYKVNKKCSIFEELKKIMFKSEGIAHSLNHIFSKDKSIKIAFIYGSYAKGTESLTSDIDLFVIGSVTSIEISRLLSRPKKELGRQINYAVFTVGEFRKKLKQKDHFLRSVLKEAKIFIVGSKDELTEIIYSRQADGA